MRTDGQKYYKVMVSTRLETDRGKVKKQNEEYLTLATGVTEAEANVVKNFVAAQDIRDYKIKSVTQTNVLEIV